MLIRTPKELGLLIREGRRSMGLDQATLAQQLGVSRSWLISVEHGKPTAPIGLVLRTLGAVGVTVDAHISAGGRPSRHGTHGVDIDAVVDRHRRRRP